MIRTSIRNLVVEGLLVWVVITLLEALINALKDKPIQDTIGSSFDQLLAIFFFAVVIMIAGD